jgi:hypothetical protein
LCTKKLAPSIAIIVTRVASVASMSGGSLKLHGLPRRFWREFKCVVKIQSSKGSLNFFKTSKIKMQKIKSMRISFESQIFLLKNNVSDSFQLNAELIFNQSMLIRKALIK